MTTSAMGGTDQRNRVERRRGRGSRYWVARESLVARLVDLVDSQLVIVRGASGSGKSVLLAQLAEALESRGVETMTVAPASGGGRPWPVLAEHLSGTAPDPLGERDLIAQALQSRPAVVVLDGFALSDEDEEILLHLLAAAPDATFVVAHRARLGLERPTTAMLFDTQIVDLDDSPLDAREVRAVLALNGLEATARVIDELIERTDGWPAAVQLVATSMRFEGGSSPADLAAVRVTVTAALDDYADVHGAGLELGSAEAIGRLAVAPYLTPAIAAAILGMSADEAECVLDGLEQKGIGRWTTVSGQPRFALTPVLRTVFGERLRDADPDDDERIRRILCTALSYEGDLLSAAETAAGIGDWPMALEILAGDADELLRVQPRRVRLLLEAAPGDDLERFPALGVRLGLLEIDREFSPALVARLGRALDGVRPAVAGATSEAVSVETLMSEARRRLGQFGRAAEHGDRLYELVTAETPGALGSAAASSALLASGLSLLHGRRLREARWRIEDAARRAADTDQSAQTAGVRALIDVTQGNVGAAAEALEGDPLAAETPAGMIARAFVAIEGGDVDIALAVLDRVDEVAPFTEYWALVTALKVWVAMMRHDPQVGVALLRSADERFVNAPTSHYFGSVLQAARSDLLVSLRQARSALEVAKSGPQATEMTAAALARAMSFAGHTHQASMFINHRLTNDSLNTRALVELLIARATVSLKLDHADAAEEALARAVALSVAQGLRQPWRFIAGEDRDALRQIASSEADELLDVSLPAYSDVLTVPALSQRELVVLRQVRSGASVAQVAKELVVSPNTVKSQLRSIYRKLRVSNRADAVRMAYEWSILTPETPVEHRARPRVPR